MTPRTSLFLKTSAALSFVIAVVGITIFSMQGKPGESRSPAPALQVDNSHQSRSSTQASREPEFQGDPYLLDVDPVSGSPLGKIENQVVRQIAGREVRFASAANARAFETDPARYLAKVDQQLVIQQLPWYPLSSCPVSGKPLDGKMGAAVDLVYKNRLVRLCCENCKQEFERSSAKFVALIDRAVVEQQLPSYKLTTCPVSSGALGSMGTPVDYVAGNRLVRFCCEGAPDRGCSKMFSNDPLKYLALL